jgi:hypothetical protein
MERQKPKKFFAIESSKAGFSGFTVKKEQENSRKQGTGKFLSLTPPILSP